MGTTIERYRVEALIGRGGMGEVYRAIDDRLRRKVALKILRPDKNQPEDVARLFREARAAAALTHPNVVSIHDLGEADGLFFIVMELVSGQPLLAYVGDGRISTARKLRWLTEIARALASAHKAGVLHRDVKPSNVMISDDDVAKVLDFGLAKTSTPAASSDFHTQAGRIVGTVRYMAPEQFAGETDARCDQYAFGVTAYELLAGSFHGPDAPSLETAFGDLPADGARAIGRMTAERPADRLPSMEDVVTTLEDLAAGRPLRLPPPSGATGNADTMPDPRAAPPASSTAATTTEPDLAPPSPAGAARVPEAVTQTLLSREAPSELRKLDPAIQKRASAAARPAAAAPAPPPPLLETTLASGARPVSPDSTPPAERSPAGAPRARSRRTAVVVIWIAIVAAAAFTGTYLGSRSRSSPGPIPQPLSTPSPPPDHT